MRRVVFYTVVAFLWPFRVSRALALFWKAHRMGVLDEDIVRASRQRDELEALLATAQLVRPFVDETQYRAAVDKWRAEYRLVNDLLNLV